MSILKAEHIRKVFKHKVAVDDVSISLRQGECVGLLGPNGAGKSTSFYLIVGILGCDSGKILLDTNDISHTPLDVRARLGIGYLPQEASVFRKLSVRDNILAILELRPDLDEAGRMQELQSLLDDFSLSHLSDSLGMRLSGGERRRLEIARALAIKPKFVLLDEPFAGVDPISVKDIKELITKLTERNIGVLITDHNVRETLSICNRAYIVANGRVLAEGSADEILANQQVRDVYLGQEFS